MQQYLSIIKHILEKGKWKENRTGIRTLACANMVFSHEMSDGFPLLTTKKVPLKIVAVELEGFIQGITSKKWYQDRSCYIWNEWSNPHKVAGIVKTKFNINASNNVNLSTNVDVQQIQKECDDLGPIYGAQWRRFNQVYDEDDDGCTTIYDQLKTIVETLKTNPNDRRMVCSAWNPCQLSRMSLPPCHYSWYLTHIDGVLNLFWTQRSIDTMLGLPFNIASYALLLLLLCRESGLKPGNLTGMLGDTHIYENHIEQAKEQITREPYTLPTVTIPKIITTEKGYEKPFNIFDWTHDGYCLFQYKHHPHIQMDVAV